MALQDKAVLVQLNIRQWTGRKFDKQATNEVTNHFFTTQKVGRFTKRLMRADEATAVASLEAVHRAGGALREYMYAQTLAWTDDGSRVLPTAHYLRFMDKMRELKASWERAVTAFIANYDSLIQKDQQRLGLLFSREDYPSREELTKKFSVALNVYPVPSKQDFRVSIEQSELDEIKENLEATMKKAYNVALESLWRRLYEMTHTVAERMADEKSRFSSEQFARLRQNCELLHELNLEGNPEFKASVEKVQRMLLRAGAVISYRADRTEIASEAAALAHELSIGGSNARTDSNTISEGENCIAA